MRVDMNDDLMAPPSPDEAAMGLETGPAQDAQNGDSAYRGAEVRCYNCAHFEEPSRCAKGINGGTVDPEAGCSQFAPAGEEAEAEEAPPLGEAMAAPEGLE